MPTEVQKKIRSTRRYFNITQRELGLAVNLTSTTISSYEIGTPPSPERAAQLFKAIFRLAKENSSRQELRISRSC
jgi:transcriptional regulator with XRE-family HTH domain